MISTKDHLRLAAILRDHQSYARGSTGRYILWLSLREDIMRLLGEDNHFDPEAFVMLTELRGVDLGKRRKSTSNGG